MGHEDVDRVTALIKKVAADRTVLMVEHNMSVVADSRTPSPCCSAGACWPRAVRRGREDPRCVEAYMGARADG